jgi:hypothetical protein
MKKADRGRFRILVVSICTLLLLAIFPAAAFAAGGTGEIKGLVTDANGEPVRTTVCAKNAEFGNCINVRDDGTYAIPGLGEGSYQVEFLSFAGEPFLAQYYDDKEFEDEAELVPVTEGEATLGIDAVMHEGGRISGTVTALFDGAPLFEIEACPTKVGGSKIIYGCAGTNAAGGYTYPGLPSGSYTIEFRPAGDCGCDSRNLIPQIAGPVEVTAGASPTRVDAAMVSTHKHKLSVSLAGDGAGAVTSSPAGIDCGALCSGEFAEAQVVTLTATAAQGSAFTGWSGGGCGEALTCRVEVDRDTAVTARFVRSIGPLDPNGGDVQRLPPPPGTKLLGAKIDATKRTATFRFRGTGSTSGFQCKLVRPATKGKNGKKSRPRFTACTSPRTYAHLAPGRYTFSVRTLGPGGPDPTPIIRRFRIPTR